jgi:hypothetical protein
VGQGSSDHLPLRMARFKGFVLEKPKKMGCNMKYWMTFTPSCTCPLNQVKTLKPSGLVGKIRSLKTSRNIYLVIHGLGTFGPIISKLVCELTFNPLLLFHHVVHILKYSLFELR